MKLKPFEQMVYHPLSERIAEMMSEITQNPNRHTFRVLLSYYLGTVASQMRAHVVGWHNSKLPINMYCITLSESGTGKGFTTRKMEQDILYRFRAIFEQETFPVQAVDHIYDLATKRVTRNPALDHQEEVERMTSEFESAGPLVWAFDDGTPAAIKQMRHKLILANAGSLNFQIDEIGDNLEGRQDAIKAFLELYDSGDIKDKLVKNTSDNARYIPIEGTTPSNLLMFGTSSSLLDAGKTEQRFRQMLESGYARRCIFSYSRETAKVTGKTAEQLVDEMFNQHHDTVSEELAEHFESMGHISVMNLDIEIGKQECLYLMKYKLLCQERGAQYNEHQAVLKAEMDHRYFKVLKLAAMYAFSDFSVNVTIDHLENAMKLVEDSGQDFLKLMTPERDYMKLGKFLSTVKEEVTLADLDESLPSFSGTKAKKEEIIQMAISWGYKNNIVIQKSFIEGIMFLKGDALKETNLDEMILSMSDHEAYRYEPYAVPFESLEQLGQENGLHWVNHHFEDNHRLLEKTIPGFNMIVLDIDGGCPLSTAMVLLEGIKAMFYTTKSHDPNDTDKHRYRVIIPISHVLKLDVEEFQQFMDAIVDTFPFEIDDSVNQINKKWLTNDGEVYFTDGKLFDALPFIPRTSKNERRMEAREQYQNLDALERWVIENTGEGNRNKQLFRFAMVHADYGASYDEIETALFELNEKLPGKLTESEIRSSIMKAVAKKVNMKE